MTRLKFDMWRYERKPGEFDGYISRFTDGKGISTESWWSNPPHSIDHVCFGYLKATYRHPNVQRDHHVAFIKRRFKEEMIRLQSGAPSVKNINLYEVSYPAEMWGDHPAYQVLITAKSAASAKYDEYLEVRDCQEITFIDFCRKVHARKVGQSVPLPGSAPFERPERIEAINRLIREIGNRGRRFLYSPQHARYAAFHFANGWLWYTDDYTGEPLLMTPKNYRMLHPRNSFSHGGTLWGLVNDFMDYILGDDNANGNRGYGGLYCEHWGYPDEDMQAIRKLAVELGYLKEKAT